MSETPNILGLDISKTRTGACWGRVGQTPHFASITGNDMSDQGAMMRLGRWLIALTKVEAFDACFIEAQIGFGAFMGRYDEEKKKVKMTSNPKTTLTLAKLIGVAEFAAGMRSISTHTPAVSTVRAAFLGNGRLKSEAAKSACRLMCGELGWSPSNHDEADAGAVWWFGGLQVKPHSTQIITPMTQKRIVSIAMGGK